MGRIVYITGGSRSGKSAYAQNLAERHAGTLLYVATAEVRDDEMADRVAKHRSARGARWQSLEEPVALAEKMPAEAAACSAILIDCLTLWLSNLLERHDDDDALFEGKTAALITVLRELDTTTYVVSNEVGSGIVPENRLARRFRDLAGRMNQQFAEAADEAWVVVSGLPLKLK